MMKATLALFPLILILSASPAFSHGVERGSVMDAIVGEGLGGMTNSTKMLLVQELMNRCDLTGLVSASADVTADPRVGADQEVTVGNYKIELNLKIAGHEAPVTIWIEASEQYTRRLNMVDSSILSIESPICR
jgi:hypothetical protein